MANKRNLLPLLGIAFVVALAASGIFYGVFVGQLRQAASRPSGQPIVVAARTMDRGTVLKRTDLKSTSWPGTLPPGAYRREEDAAGQTLFTSIQENEPLTESRVSGGKSTGIAEGMRAVSVHVLDSGGLVPFLRAGNRVDVQAVKNRGNAQAALRTVLQNVEVLAVQAPEANYGAQNPVTVSLLATPEDADRIALADSGANIRLLLRNPLDRDQTPRPRLQLASLFHELPARAPASPGEGALENKLELLVRVGGPTSSSMESVRSSIAGLHEGDMLQVAALPHGQDGDRVWSELQSTEHVEPLQLTKLTASNLQPAYFRASKDLRIRFESRIDTARSFRLRVQPEVTGAKEAGGVRSQRLVTDLDLQDGQSLVIAGRELIVVATARRVPKP